MEYGRLGALCIILSGVLEQSFEAQYWSGVESDVGVAKVEWSAVVCVCVRVCVCMCVCARACMLACVCY